MNSPLATRHSSPSVNRNSPESLEQRLKNAEDALTNALNLIGAMQPVCTAADIFFNSDYSDLSQLGIATANYRDYAARNAPIHPKARRPADHRGSQGEADQTCAPDVTVGSTGS